MPENIAVKARIEELIDLTDEEAAALVRELRETVMSDRRPFSRRVGVTRAGRQEADHDGVRRAIRRSSGSISSICDATALCKRIAVTKRCGDIRVPEWTRTERREISRLSEYRDGLHQHAGKRHLIVSEHATPYRVVAKCHEARYEADEWEMPMFDFLINKQRVTLLEVAQAPEDQHPQAWPARAAAYRICIEAAQVGAWTQSQSGQVLDPKRRANRVSMGAKQLMRKSVTTPSSLRHLESDGNPSE